MFVRPIMSADRRNRSNADGLNQLDAIAERIIPVLVHECARRDFHGAGSHEFDNADGRLEYTGNRERGDCRALSVY